MNHKLSQNDIQQCDDPYGTVADYFHVMSITFNDGNGPDVPPTGRDLLLLLNVDSEYHNGGLWQYFANRTDDSGTLSDEVRRLPQVLEEMGATEMSSLVREATACWLELAERVPEEKIEDARNRFFEQGQLQMELFDQSFGSIYERTTAIVSEYIRNHADDFCQISES